MPAQPTAPRRPQKRTGKFAAWFVLLVLLAAGGTAASVMVAERSEVTENGSPASRAASDSVPSDRSAAPVADDSQSQVSGSLPDLQFPRPALTSAEWVETISLPVPDGADTWQVVTQNTHFVADFAALATHVEVTSSNPADAPKVSIVTATDVYEPGATFGAPWTRRESSSDRDELAVADPTYLDVYQDLITPTVRGGATNVSTTTAVVDGLALTTFTFDVDMRDLDDGSWLPSPGSGPVAADELIGRMYVTIDDTGLVRQWQFQLDETRARATAPAADMDMIPLSFSGELVSVNAPVDVTIPDAERILDEVCVLEQRTMSVAIEAWYAVTGSATPPAEADLVPDFLRSESELVDIVDGAIVGAPGSRCA